MIARNEVEQVLDKLGDAPRRRSHVRHAVALENADAPAAKTPRLVRESLHEHRVGREQVLPSARGPLRRRLVRTERVRDLGDCRRRARDALPLEERGDMRFVERAEEAESP